MKVKELFSKLEAIYFHLLVKGLKDNVQSSELVSVTDMQQDVLKADGVLHCDAVHGMKPATSHMLISFPVNICSQHLSVRSVKCSTRPSTVLPAHSIGPSPTLNKVCDSCCVSVQGLRPLKDSAFVVFEGRVLQRDLVNLVSRC